MALKLAGRRIGVETVFGSTLALCREYLDDFPGNVDFSVCTTSADIALEGEKSRREDEAEGIPVRQFSDEYLETLAVYRKIAERMPDYDTFLFHGSAIAVDGVGYLFTAKSGTGKSTHTRLWRELLGNRAVMVNDDKPLIHVDGDGVTVYGTPWDGKHRLSSNISVPLRAICLLERGQQNEIYAIPPGEAWPMLLQQAYRPADAAAMMKTLTLLDRLTKTVRLYRLRCNMEPEAAELAWNTMRGNKKMKLKPDFITHDTGAESLLVPTGKAAFSGLVKGNKTLGAILELLKTETTETEIVSALKSRFDAPEGAVEQDVAKALSELRKIGALDE